MRVIKEQTQVLMVDIQEKLVPHMSNPKRLLENCAKLIKGLQLLELPFILNEQYPKGIGKTQGSLQELVGSSEAYEKFTFSCCQTQSTMDAICAMDKKFVIVFGIEAHVCVMQSVLDLLEAGFIPVVVCDCVDSRKPSDTDFALKRMIQAGAVPTTLESLLFELCVSAKNPIFKGISQLIK
ncbi:MAG: hydrolase [Sulfurospirillum sp.]|nr:hydrolase [Sulfurospirillum sp.]